MNYLRSFIWILILAGACGPLSAQPEAETWDDARMKHIPASWLEWDTYEQDPQAAAVIINDQAFANLEYISRASSVRYVYRRQIKIFKESATSLSRVSIYYNPRQESIGDIRGATWQLNVKGKPIAFKINRRSIREEKQPDGRVRVQFDLPFVKPGSVIEYSWSLRTRNYRQLKSWQFQQDLPVMRSEFRFTSPEYYHYQAVATGDVSALQSDQRYIYVTLPAALNGSPTDPSSQFTQSLRRNMPVNLLVQGYLMTDLAALKAEAFTPEIPLFAPTITLQLAGGPGNVSGSDAIFNSWESLGRYMQRKMRSSRAERELSGMTPPEADPGSSTEQKVRLAWEWVRENFEWDGTYALTPGGINRFFETRKGSSADINYLLIKVLQQAGLDVYPVLLSTRGHGPVQNEFPVLAQFNHLVVAVKEGKNDILLDAAGSTDDALLLPVADLNQSGLVLEPGNIRWVSLLGQNKLIRYTYSRFDLDSTGQLSGELRVIHEGYGASLEREKLSTFDGTDIDYLKRYLMNSATQFQILDDSIYNRDLKGKSLEVSCHIKMRDFVQPAEEMIFVKPMLTRTLQENPLPDKARNTPLDFDFPIRESNMLGLRLPDGYEVVQLPAPVRVVLPGGAGFFTYNVLQMERILHFSSTVYINRTLFAPEEYETLRMFFDYIFNKHQEDIVLRRSGS
ncbi:MAG: DUF3857 domain-containing protein [Bacteroidetes bacterium]|nr:MAG: DUF3857 domain-containing protein [Bacteroidota bacterium]